MAFHLDFLHMMSEFTGAETVVLILRSVNCVAAVVHFGTCVKQEILDMVS